MRGPQYQPASRFSRAFLRPSIVPEVVISAVVIGCAHRVGSCISVCCDTIGRFMVSVKSSRLPYECHRATPS